MTNIYDNSWKPRLTTHPIGRMVVRATKIAGRNVDTTIDTYPRMFAIQAQKVTRLELPPSQKLILSQDPKYNSGPLYLVTMASVDMSKGSAMEREFYATPKDLKTLEIAEAPTKDRKIGAGKEALSDTAWNVGTKGQFWGAFRPRIHDLEKAPSEQQELNQALQKPVRKNPVWKFISPKP